MNEKCECGGSLKRTATFVLSIYEKGDPRRVERSAWSCRACGRVRYVPVAKAST